MEKYNESLKGVQGTLQDISTAISFIYKTSPDNRMTRTLQQTHAELDNLNDYFDLKDTPSALPVIKPKRIKKISAKSIDLTKTNLFSQKFTTTTRKKYQLTCTPSKSNRLHSNNSYTRPAFQRTSRSRVISKATRSDPVANPAEISSEDKELGLFSIVNRGLVSKDTDLSSYFSDISSSRRKQIPSSLYQKLQSPEKKSRIKVSLNGSLKKKITEEVKTIDLKSLNEIMSKIPVSPNKRPVLTTEKFYLVVKRGKLKQNEDFFNFKEKHRLHKGLDEALNKLQVLCKVLRYPKVIIDASKLLENSFDEMKKLDVRLLKKCIVNSEEISKTMKDHKVPYRGKAGKHLAAVKIQSAFRMYYAAKQYRHLRALNMKAKFIQLYFRLYLKKLATKKNISSVKQERISKFFERQKAFQENWLKIKEQERVEIHLGSVRPDKTKSFYYSKQNSQIMRVFALSDPKVSVIYVSPVVLHSDIIEYYYSVLSLCNIKNIKERLKFVSPSHGLDLNNLYSTSKLLFLSSSTLKEIKSAVAGKFAYIVPNEVSDDDLWVSDLLNIPLLSGYPEVANGLSTKTGCTEVFKKAGISVPLQIFSFNTPEIFYSEFSKLIFTKFFNDIWMIKINTENNSRGIAYLDVSKLKTVTKLRKAETIKPEYLAQLHQELIKSIPFLVKFVTFTLWENWNIFLHTLCRKGGVIQETPATKSNVACPCISILIDPNGDIRYLCAVDRMQSRDYLNSGYFYPQASLRHSEILDIGYRVGKELFAQEIIGYVSIELLAFPDPYNDGGLPIYWGIDLSLNIGLIGSSYLMFNTLTGGFIDGQSGRHFIEFDDQDDELSVAEDRFGDNFTNMLTTNKPTRTRDLFALPEVIKGNTEDLDRNVEDFNRYDERSFLYCWHIEHPDLKDLSIEGLFHMCRLESMTFNLEYCKGSAFTIYDKLSSHYFGIIAVGSNRQDTIRALSDTFTFILQQAGPPPQPPVSYNKIGKEDYNLNELITKVKSIHKTLEKISKYGRKNFLVELL